MKTILFTFLLSCSTLAAPSIQHQIVPVDLDKGAKLVSLQTGEALLIGSIVQKFDPQTLKWHKLPPLQFPRRWGHALALDNGKV